MCIVIAERRKAKGKSFKFDYQPNQRKELSMSRIFKGSCGYDIVARYEDGRILAGNFGYDIVGRIEDGKILEGNFGYTVAARFEDGKVYEGNFGCHIIGRYEGGARSGAAAAAFFSVL